MGSEPPRRFRPYETQSAAFVFSGLRGATPQLLMLSKRALVAGERLLGLWVNFAHAPIVEVLAGSGFDWLLLDMEYTPSDFHIVGKQLLALRGTPVAPIVRVPIHDMAWIKRVLDAGAPNVIVPNIRSVEEAREVLSWTRFALDGLRGVASSTHASG